MAGMMNGVFMRRNTVVLGFGACEHPLFGPKQFKFFPMNAIVVSGHNVVFWHRTHPLCGNRSYHVLQEEEIHWPLAAFDSALSKSLQLVGKELAVDRRLHLIDDGRIDIVQCMQITPNPAAARGCVGLNLAEFKRSGRLDQLKSSTPGNTSGLSDQEVRCAGQCLVLPSHPTHCQEPLRIPCAEYSMVCSLEGTRNEKCITTCHVAASV